ncbi:hypothetical protein D9M73_176960 [compost metagenome]
MGKISARKHGRVPSFIASIRPKPIWIARIRANEWSPRAWNSGRVSARNSSEASTSMVLRPKRSDSMPIRKMKPM